MKYHILREKLATALIEYLAKSSERAIKYIAEVDVVLACKHNWQMGSDTNARHTRPYWCKNCGIDINSSRDPDKMSADDVDELVLLTAISRMPVA